ncbi:Multidrug resistance protein ABC transporter [Phytophthora megakarya]|uniref:Multidrug resistance protein ABC transporter n=1 Tax=Phytophthora megakarya TaxID=4795 RepID=A0A225VZZ3_9STRA|nr:Multidrug resistance protein ABC transporter [Phytophthora megakarya]
MGLVFRKKKLTEIVSVTLQRDTLTTDEGKTKFDEEQVTIMQLIGMSLPADKLHQIRHKTTGTEMWKALCDIYECTKNQTTIAHRSRCLRNELDTTKLHPGGDVNEHLSKMVNIRTELTSLNYNVEDIDMVEMLLESLPNQYEFGSLKSGIRYNLGVGVTTSERTRQGRSKPA